MTTAAVSMSPEDAFNNVQQIVRKCKDPALSMEQGDILRESLQVIADRIVVARESELKLKALEEKVATLETEKTALEAKAANAAIPPGFMLVPIPPPPTPVVAELSKAPAPPTTLIGLAPSS